VRGVELLELGERQVVDGAAPVRRPVDGRVVDHDDLAVCRRVDVELEHVRAAGPCALERVHRVRRPLELAALVREVEDPLAEPRVLRVRGGGRRQRPCKAGDQHGCRSARHGFSSADEAR
jgi:hypothetical protein